MYTRPAVWRSHESTQRKIRWHCELQWATLVTRNRKTKLHCDKRVCKLEHLLYVIYDMTRTMIQWNLLLIHVHEAVTVDAVKSLIPVTVLTPIYHN